jgi:hypothetical protein
MLARTPITQPVTFVALVVLGDDRWRSESQAVHGFGCWSWTGSRDMSVRRTWNERDGHRMIGPIGGRGVRQEQDMHASLRVLDRQQLAVWNSRRPRTTITMASFWGGRTGSESRCQCRHSVGEHFRLKASIFAACPNSKERCCDIGRPCDHLGTCSHFQGDK